VAQSDQGREYQREYDVAAFAFPVLLGDELKIQ
jgi:hypothetical protein